MANYRSIRDLDWPLVILTMIICALGELQIYSATRETIFRNAWWKQLLYIAVGLFVMWLITNIDYHTLLGQTPLLYGLTIASLALTYVVGAKFFGSRRWIPRTICPGAPCPCNHRRGLSNSQWHNLCP